MGSWFKLRWVGVSSPLRSRYAARLKRVPVVYGWVPAKLDTTNATHGLPVLPDFGECVRID